MRGLVVLIAIASAALPAGCDGEKGVVPASPEPKGAQPGPGRAGDAGRPGGDGKGAAASASSSPAATIPAERARAVLDAWLAAQNGGDFAAYEKLYADKFEGVKRVGDRVSRFARAGWMADRKRMFGKPMAVEAREPVIATTATTAEIRFVQRWQSGKFEDVGPKRLFLVAKGDGLAIAREEMLESEVVRAKGGEGAAGERTFGFVLDIMEIKKTYIVLDHVAVPDERGAPRLDRAGGDFYIASAPIADAQVGPELAAWKGAKVVTDVNCESRVVGFRVVSLEVPHFGTVQEWNGGYDGSGDAASGAEIAYSVSTSGHSAVAAELADFCAGVLATPAGKPLPVDGEKIDDDAIEKAARARFAKLDEVVELQAEHRAQKREGNWWDENIEVHIFKHPTSGRTIASVRADNRGSCGEFAASAWVLYEVKGRSLSQLHMGSPPAEVVSAIDEDGDGSLELLTHDNFGGLLVLVGSDGQERGALRYAYNDCPC
jgi:hypothetical protein